MVTSVSSSYDVPGAYSAYIQEPDYYPEAGTVVIKVRVLKDGSVYDAVVDEERSTVKYSSQQRSARSAIEESYFLVSDSAQADTLSGIVTYVFLELSPKQLDSLQTEYLSSIDKSLRILRNQSSHELLPTDNMWIFLELDTRTGVIYQLQFTVKGDPDYRGKFILNSKDLRLDSWVHQNDWAPGRFKMYKTQNIYTFILLDSFDGRTWQVQWSTDPSNRGIIPIK